MARRSKKPCKKIGCPNLVEHPNKYCASHQDIGQEEKEERNKLYDKYVRHGKDKRYTQFYHSKDWEKARQQSLLRDNGLCQQCLQEDKITLADMVHHIVSIKDDWSKRLDLMNLVSLCNDCHNRIEH